MNILQNQNHTESEVRTVERLFVMCSLY